MTVAASGRTLLSKRSSTSSRHRTYNSRKISRSVKIDSLRGPSSASHLPICASQCKAPQHLTTRAQPQLNRARIRDLPASSSKFPQRQLRLIIQKDKARCTWHGKILLKHLVRHSRPLKRQTKCRQINHIVENQSNKCHNFTRVPLVSISSKLLHQSSQKSPCRSKSKNHRK